MHSSMTLEEVKEDDLDEIFAIETASSLTPWSRKLFLEEMAHPYGHCFSMILHGDPKPRLIAYLCFRTLGDESELLNLAVHPDYRRRGVARHLLVFYIDFCRREKVRKSFLEVATENEAALHLYRSFNYRPAGRRPGFYLGRFDALTMEKEIEERGKEEDSLFP
jgi:ribosomal-protein-alanine N-acetyltransferase